LPEGGGTAFQASGSASHPLGFGRKLVANLNAAGELGGHRIDSMVPSEVVERQAPAGRTIEFQTCTSDLATPGPVFPA
jgi:hypothetical protein